MSTSSGNSSKAWGLYIKLFLFLRQLYFSAPRPDGEYIVLEKSVENTEDLLGDMNFTNDWEFSYYKRGEDLNMRIPMRKNDEYEWYQLHVRGWEEGDTVELKAHEELEPSEYPKQHLNNVNFDEQAGMDKFQMMLVSRGVEHSFKEI